MAAEEARPKPHKLRTVQTFAAIHRHVMTSSGVIYWAACETGHAIWSGPERDSYNDASTDATKHDQKSHGGVGTAVVLNTLMVSAAKVDVSATLQCLSWRGISPGRGAIVNRCTKCMKATLLKIDWNQNSSVGYVDVPGPGYREVDITGLRSIEIIGESPC